MCLKENQGYFDACSPSPVTIFQTDMKQKCETYKWVKMPSSQDWSNINLGHSWEIQPQMVGNQNLSLIAAWVGKFKSVQSKFEEKKRKRVLFF